GDLTIAQEHLIGARASTGNRLSALTAAAESRLATGLSLETTLSGLRDVNYAEAASQFTMQLTALEAAQQVTLRIQGLSLINKLQRIASYFLKLPQPVPLPFSAAEQS